MRERRMYVERDRCKKSITLQLKSIKEGGVKLDVAEDAPEGWLHEDGHDFCPDCAQKYQRYKKDFWGK